MVKILKKKISKKSAFLFLTTAVVFYVLGLLSAHWAIFYNLKKYGII